jgi:hypothetical protein
MEIKDYVKIYDDILRYETLSNFIKWINTQENFEDARIGQGYGFVNKKIRSVKNLFLTENNNSLTNVHWYNVLSKIFKIYFDKYVTDNNFSVSTRPFAFKNECDVTVLKYEAETEDHYDVHVDQGGMHNTRLMSFIFLLNNDYEGGEICFCDSDESERFTIQTKANRLVMWPSNFLFPHKIKKVVKGKRYSVVSWLA